MPTKRAPRVSIIIPSHNRRPRLILALEAIARQRFPLETVEVIVVADGCHDDTVAAVTAFSAPFALRVTELPGVGPAIARNRGAELASAPLLLFLDDDVEPLDQWIGAHVEAHETHPDSAVIGPYPPWPDGSRDEFRALVRNWWMAHFDELSRPGHRFTYRDMLTGNLSMTRDTWVGQGGFDPDFARAHEDWELGVRVIDARIPIVYAERAFCWHHEHETMTLEGALRRAREEGRTDVRLGRKHPHVGADLPLVAHWRAAGLAGRVGRLGFAVRGVGEGFASVSAALTGRLRKFPSSPVFRKAFGMAQRFAYLRGAAEELRSLAALVDFADSFPARKAKSILVDLGDGIDEAERKLARERPDEARLKYGHNDVGWLPYAPGAERWDARHLRPYLAGEMSSAMLYALLTAGALMRPRDEEAECAAGPSSRAWGHLNKKGYFPALGESLDQWSDSGL